MASENMVRMEHAMEQSRLSTLLLRQYEKGTFTLADGTEIPLSTAQINALKAAFAASRSYGTSQWGNVSGKK